MAGPWPSSIKTSQAASALGRQSLGWPEGYTTAHRDPVAVPTVCKAHKRVTQNAPVRLRQNEPQDNLDLAFKGAQNWRKFWNWSVHASKWENWRAL